MTRFEELMRKSYLCLQVALKMENDMKEVYAQKARELKKMAYSLTVAEASAEVRK